MAIDLEEESRINGETIASPSSGATKKVAGVLLFSAAAAVIGYQVWKTYKPGDARTPPEEQFATAQQNADLKFDVPSAKTENKLKLPPPSKPIEPPAPAPVVAIAVPPIIQAPVTAPAPVDDGEAKRLAEAEAARKRAEEERMKRLRSPMLIIDNGAQAVQATAAETGAGTVGQGDKEDDPNRRFMNARSGEGVQLVEATKNNRIDALIPQGTMIRGVLETAIQSDLPGMVRAVTSQDVYSFDGRRILLQKGTMLTGEYKSALSRGQTRVMVVWTRALRSDGVSIALGSYGTDDLGRSGLSGDIDNHYLERFGAPAVLSIVGGLSSFVAGLDSNGNSNSGSSGGYASQQAQTQAQQVISQTMSDMANTALRDSINIPPTIHVDQGTQVIIFVRRDLDFSSLYPDPVKEALYELRHPNRAKSSGTSNVGGSPNLFPAGSGADQGMVRKP